MRHRGLELAWPLLALIAACGGEDEPAPAPPNGCPALASDATHRFVLALDTCVEPLGSEAIGALDDPFARGVLRQGLFPRDLAEFEAAMRQAAPDWVQAHYAISETAHLPAFVDAFDPEGGLRYVVTWGPALSDARVFLGVFAPSASSSLHEVIALDAASDVFNFYELRRQVGVTEGPRVWSWAGDTRLAPLPAVDGHSCFNCHHSGRPIMREIERPWPNWHSQRSATSALDVPPDVAVDPPFAARLGAENLARAVGGAVIGHQARSFDARIESTDRGWRITDADRLLRPLWVATTVNFASSDVPSRSADTSPPGRDIDGVPPRDTFTWDSILFGALGLPYTPLRTTLPRAEYDAVLGARGFAIDVGAAQVPGSTYFAFMVPQAAAEDTYAVRELLRRGLVDPRFVAAAVMVDLGAAPLSAGRAGMAHHLEVLGGERLVDDLGLLTDDVIRSIRASGAAPCPIDGLQGAPLVAAFEACSAEAQFLAIWDAAGDEWRAVAGALLDARAAAFVDGPPAEQVERLMAWSVERRQIFASTLPYCKLNDAASFLPRVDMTEGGRCVGRQPPLAADE